MERMSEAIAENIVVTISILRSVRVDSPATVRSFVPDRLVVTSCLQMRC
jgi:hypothetical protein